MISENWLVLWSSVAGIIRKTRTVMECLHRFCRDCIDKSMRLGYAPLCYLSAIFVSVSSLKEVYIQLYFNDNISDACIFAEIMNARHAALIARADVP
jgi:hypothetical protein